MGHIALRKLLVAGRVVARMSCCRSRLRLNFPPKLRVEFAVSSLKKTSAGCGGNPPASDFASQAMVQTHSPDDLKMVVMHELEHIRRRDTILMFIAQLATIVHWYNPLVYWLQRRVQAQAEMAVDASTVHKIGVEKVNQYAELLFKIASVTRTPAYLLSMLAIPQPSGSVSSNGGHRAPALPFEPF